VGGQGQLNAMLLSYNLSAIVYFPTRVQNQSNTATYNIFIDIHKITNYTVSPIYNGLSDHDAQLLIVKDVNLQLFKQYIYTIRNIHKYSIEHFKIRHRQDQIHFPEWGLLSCSLEYRMTAKPKNPIIPGGDQINE
jgi:hypothetical protein